MPRHRSLNQKKFVDSIHESLIEGYFEQKMEGRMSFALERGWIRGWIRGNEEKIFGDVLTEPNSSKPSLRGTKVLRRT